MSDPDRDPLDPRPPAPGGWPSGPPEAPGGWTPGPPEAPGGPAVPPTSLGPEEAASLGEPLGPGKAPRSWWKGPAEWIFVIVAALAAAFLVKTFVLQTFFIPSASMEPTLMIGDRVFVNKLSYNFHDVHRGDVVVFTLPPGETAGPNIDDLIKRVVGLPGDTIEAIGGRVYIDGKALNEPYLPKGTVTTLLPRQKVPPGHYFLMGDNRTDSKDSRFFGPINQSLLVGRAFVRVWPFSRFGLL